MSKVLVVDDLQDVADSFAELLTLFGHGVRVAYSAADALNQMRDAVPDAALLDVSMRSSMASNWHAKFARRGERRRYVSSHTLLTRGRA